MSKKKTNDEEKLEIGHRLKELRELKALTQAEVEKDTGITRKNISCYENNVYNPPLVVLEKLSRYYNTSIDYIVSGIEIEYKDVKVRDKTLLGFFEKIDLFDSETKKSMAVVLNYVVNGYKEKKS